LLLGQTWFRGADTPYNLIKVLSLLRDGTPEINPEIKSGSLGVLFVYISKS